MSEEKEQKELSPEQVEANRKKIISYYKKQIEILDLQAKYETLMADIETSRVRRMEMIIRQAQMSAGPEDEAQNQTGPEHPDDRSLRDQVEGQEVAPTLEKKERKLKTQ